MATVPVVEGAVHLLRKQVEPLEAQSEGKKQYVGLSCEYVACGQTAFSQASLPATLRNHARCNLVLAALSIQ